MLARVILFVYFRTAYSTEQYQPIYIEKNYYII